jgi:hypothetical protein
MEGASRSPSVVGWTSVHGTKQEKTSICGLGWNRRILKYDYYGRSLQGWLS